MFFQPASKFPCPAWGRGVLSELAMHSPSPFPINNDRSISFIEQGKQCLYITSKLKVCIEISVLLKGFIEVRVKGNVSLHSFICTCEKALTLLKIDLAFNFCHQMTKKGAFDYLGDVHTINFVWETTAKMKLNRPCHGFRRHLDE